MKAIVLAYHNIGCVGIDALLRNGFEVVSVFTHKDNPAENLWFESVAVHAAKLGIPVFAPDNINHPIWVQKIKELKPDIIFSFYYRNMIKKPLLEIPSAGCLNLHGSLLPAYRGRCPINWVLINGEQETGVTLHYMTPHPDDGDIVGQKKIEISDDDTAKSLHLKAAQTSVVLLDEVLPLIRKGKATGKPQNHSKATYYGGRKPEDGEIDWSATSREIRNLVRATTQPYPGAFSFIGNTKYLFWTVQELSEKDDNASPGTILSIKPLVIACGKGAIQVEFGQTEKGVFTSGEQLAMENHLAKGMQFGPSHDSHVEVMTKKKVLILGVNGFIGNALSEKLLSTGKYEVHGMDLNSNNIESFLQKPHFYFHEGDLSIHREWVEYHVRKCDVVLPLVAIATPIEYTRNPLRVFELDFEENLRVIRYCVKYKKRIIFPSTSEVYGMCDEKEFDEDNSKLILGPIRMQRWIYSCCKQLLDRVIWAYGQKEGLKFTIFRPFNWIGPKLDSLTSARIGSSRAITQLILNLVEGTPIQLIDGGRQKRCFTDVTDGIEALYRVIENKNNVCDGQIINIGNPDNEAGIKELAEILIAKFNEHPLRSQFPPLAGVQEVESSSYYGAGYQDLQHRKPSIRNAQRLLNWNPVVPFETSVSQTLDFFLKEAVKSKKLRNAYTNSESAQNQSSQSAYSEIKKPKIVSISPASEKERESVRES